MKLRPDEKKIGLVRDLNPNKPTGSGSLFWFQIMIYLKLLTNYSTRHSNMNTITIILPLCGLIIFVMPLIGIEECAPKSLEYNFAGFFCY